MSHLLKYRISRIIFLIAITYLPINTYGQSAKEEPVKEVKNNDDKTQQEDIQFEKLLDEELNPKDNKDQKPVTEPTNWAFQILKTVFGLGIIIFFIYLFKRYMVFKNSFGSVETGIIKILHEYPVATGKKMQLIEIGSKILLVGISDAGLQLITEFKEKASIDQIKMSIDSYGNNEPRDIWIEASKAIKNKINDLLQGKKHNVKPEDGDWTRLQSDARKKIKELQDKKKVFEDNEKFNDTLF